MVRLSLKLLATAVGACFAFSVRAFVPGPTLAPLVEAVSPAVVCIRTQNADGGMRDGAGFIVSEDGLILSNDHVVKDAEQINMTLADGTVLKGYVVGRDGKTDVALLKAVTETPLPAVDFATSAGVRTGDWVLALGNPYGLGLSASAGIISARGRALQGAPQDDFLQTDAVVHRGNSGGPLFNLDGRVIGMSTAILSPQADEAGLNFALPSDTLVWVLEQLKKDGVVKRPKLGLQVLFDKNIGLYVSDVDPDGPAARAGVLPGDVLTALDGQPLTGVQTLGGLMRHLSVGKTVTLTLMRDQTPVTVSFPPAEDIDGVLKTPELSENSHAN